MTTPNERERDEMARDVLQKFGFISHRGFGVAAINALRKMLKASDFELRNPGYDRATVERCVQAYDRKERRTK